MNSPFPGMYPYIEAGALWGNFHFSPACDSTAACKYNERGSISGPCTGDERHAGSRLDPR